MNKKEYEEARKMLEANHTATTNWLRKHKTNAMAVDVSQTMPYADKVNNTLRSQVEAYDFEHEKPDKYFVYISKGKGRQRTRATTWTGQLLGYVWEGKVWRSNLGDRRQSITVKGINGVKYYGTYYFDRGDYARIKAYKNQKEVEYGI